MLTSVQRRFLDFNGFVVDCNLNNQYWIDKRICHYIFDGIPLHYNC